MRTRAISLLIYVALLPMTGTEESPGKGAQVSAADRLGSTISAQPIQLADVPALRERVGYDALEKQYQALTRMPSVTVQYAINGTARKIAGSTGVYLPVSSGLFTNGAATSEVIEKFGAAVLATGTEELRVTRIHKPQAWLGPDGNPGAAERTIKFDQYIRGRPVLLGWANISVKESSGEVTSFVSHFLPDRGLPSEPQVSSSAAVELLVERMRAETGGKPVELIVSDTPPSLAYAFETIGDQGAGSGDLVWVVEITRKDSQSLQHLRASISATTGEVLRLTSETSGSLFRMAYSASGVATPPPSFPQGLTFLFGEGQPPNDTQAGNAYVHAGTTYQAYQQIFGRDSMNGVGGAIKLVVHYPFPSGGMALYHNDYLIFGEAGGGMVSGTSNLDTVAHEYGHGVVKADAGFSSADDLVDGAAALNEAYGDLSSAIVDVNIHGAPSTSTWTMLELFAYDPSVGVRYWNVPQFGGLFYRDWFPERSHLVIKEGGQYFNTTIFGHAFYLLTNGGNHYRAGLPGSGIPVIPVPQVGYETTRNAFYTALSNVLLGPTSNFFDYRDATVQAAPNAQVGISIRKGWDAVGVGFACTVPPPPPTMILENFYCKGKYRVHWLAVPGATQYNAQKVPAGWGWGYATTAVDANVESCMQQVSVTTNIRLRACNGCGCSGWAPAQTMQYYPICY